MPSCNHMCCHSYNGSRSHFQQDNARPHTTMVSQECIGTVTTFPWTVLSPDLSPSEHIWDHFGREVAIPRNESDGRKLSSSNLDSDEDIRLREGDCEESEESAGEVDNIPVNPYMYLVGVAQKGTA
ncbi:hypothetical protein TNCV_2308811 [Trichonephila clavipes]|nr:hypothetical protein TNCV_2308811 [Trichonephila clavipes]